MEDIIIEIFAQVTNEPTSSISAEDECECKICFERLYKSLKTPCGHKFCSKCIMEWTLTQYRDGLSKTCPFCRTNIEEIIHSVEVKTHLENPISTHAFQDFQTSLTELLKVLHSYQHFIVQIEILSRDLTKNIQKCLIEFLYFL